MSSVPFVRASGLHKWLLALAAAMPIAGACRDVAPSAAVPEGPVATSAAAATRTSGYLLPAERPDSIALLPPPPKRGSVAYRADRKLYKKLQSLEGGARWKLAAIDANLQFPQAANVFACELGFAVEREKTPHLYTLLQRTVIDAGQSTYPAKVKYNTKRPFENTGDAICTPDFEQSLRGNASYPSGHASLGYVWGELLAEVVPQHAAALRARGYEFGQSRVICRLHYQSDVEAGRMVGQTVIPRLHQNAQFLGDLAAAKVEAQQALALAAGPGRDCSAEARALVESAPLWAPASSTRSPIE